jgi:O-acetyl-ADP-ribose deacetylase (regulator of RNase III)
MIIEVQGDILLSQAAAIAHGIAPNDHMDRGLALALRERWPAMAKDFRHYCRAEHPKAGAAWAWKGSGGPVIVSLLTQKAAANADGRPGRAHTEYVNHALRELRRIVLEEKLASLALPKLATGVGGLAWEEVEPLIRNHLGDLSIPVFVYTTYRPNLAADEHLAAGPSHGKGARASAH